MDLSGFVEKLLLNINKEIEERSKDITDGIPQDYESYKYIVGIIKGLKRSHSIILDTKKKFIYGTTESNSSNNDLTTTIQSIFVGPL